MNRVSIPQGYRSSLNLYETQGAIDLVKVIFSDRLSRGLELRRVSAPLFVDPQTGLNDNLNGVERPVTFDIPACGREAEIIHSLAKWKRMALHRYGFREGGLYTDMNAIRRDEELSNLHSIYVDQWDWEKIITPEQRNQDYLRATVRQIVAAIAETARVVAEAYPSVPAAVTADVAFVSAQELADRWPELTPKQREHAICRELGTVFVGGIGGLLASGQRHDGRAPDYDDWSLNGDILFWNDVLGQSFEVSSMGIRVDRAAMDRQLTLAGCDDRRQLPFHRLILEDRLPLTMGGGIGQSRLSMLLLGKAHIGEVQASVWDDETLRVCKEAGVELL